MDYLSELRMYPCFSNNGNNLDINISYENEETSRIIDYDNISKYFGINESVLSITNEIELICSLKKEVNKFINFSGTTIRYRKYDKLNYQNIISAALNNNNELNCRYKSFIFAQVLIALGFKARWVGCLSKDLNDSECHCITEVYSKDLNKWIAIDISFDYIYFDSKGNLLNLIEMRSKIISGERLRFLSKKKCFISDTHKYLEKNLFQFRFSSHYQYNTSIYPDKVILLYPDKYDKFNYNTNEFDIMTTNSKLFW